MAFAINANAQLGSWTALNIRGKINDKFLYFGEAQIRSTAFYNNFFYYEAKGAIGFTPGKNISLLVGSGLYDTYPVGGNFNRPRATREIRTWLEATFKHDISRFFFEHRYRIEQRFLNTGYRNRFRYRLAALMPVNKPTLVPNTFFLCGFEELFLGNQAPYFERNRVFAGLGYKFKSVILQLGWLNQFDYKLTGSISRQFLQTFVTVEIGKSKPKNTLPFGQD